jgi:hypothetical protein
MRNDHDMVAPLIGIFETLDDLGDIGALRHCRDG